MHYALEGAVIDDHARRRLEAIGADIAKKLKWSPLAARIVGGRLGRRLSAEFWTTVKNGNVDGTMGALRWSYLQLDQQARRCFAYCSIFPRRHHLIRDDLVKLWVAEGFVRGTNEGEEMEDVCRGYFDELVSTSFLQPGGKVLYNDMDYYLVHDMLHDLADSVAGSDCFRIENGSIWSKLREGKGQRREGWRGDVPRDVHHLFVQNYDGELITEKILQLENLRTLIIYAVGGGTPIEEKVIASILKRLRKLRVLAVALSHEDDAVIKEPDVFLVPESISKLKHLRYLAFRTSMSCRVILPGTVTKLYHMQLVDFGQCKKLVFPSADLINLRHIFCSIDLDFPDIGKLTSLQTVPNFTVWNVEGYKVNQLRDLNKLRGSLEICHLENVESKVEALEANLAAKERLTHLSLGWGVAMRSSHPEVEAGAFGSLCPSTWLETLYMYNYQGLRYLNKLRGSLEILRLDNVESKVEALEANLAAKERLTHLSLSRSGATRSSSPEVEAEVFESLCPPIWLETLYIYNYRGLRYPNWMVGKQNGGLKDLRGLKLHGWSQLGPAPRLEAFVHLRSLTVWDCSWDALPDNMENLTLLKDLMICECLNISSLPTLPQALEEFTLKWCSDELMKSCQTIGHPNWGKIENVPKKEFTCPEGYEIDLLRIRNKRASLGTDIRRQ
ncbi:hypothetical protein BRADI_3g61040v3 [Brachypodium distachyon]|uniref:NB-ARC domain-containing protein n=1 Tax=Brachypodium distachyon TaxID=15368 RepID=A0A0Q3I8T5_BRADI|nr:hypothetical protein BRADI_3g61040v3 [Brachypodium distachyon]PNT69772.1 hypothetical protein BRADI_3g61040v3 [Brachypodium distachyon]PNT69773.1 hypothetical protein BRADI_3g61040v3 [Brachypodium distachyon]PNT69774.1 hypothetical protein BRADI_3g61040v3 [Brachypodium distachyon]PNT69775.1 hypothetical protein BRADI_3g61040v3 [Brachypodium distachyon]